MSINKQITKALNIIIGFIITFVVISQLYSLFQMKAFWLDEWFILYNLKYKSYTELFDNLFYIQQFPRLYLVIIKFIAEITNYNYFALRFMPTIMQLINIMFVTFVIRKIIFKKNNFQSFIFLLFFLSFQVTIIYFTQLKQYTMEMFFSLLSVYFYFYLSKKYEEIKIMSPSYLLILVGIFLGSFFSYTFPITITPLLFILFITTIYNFKNKKIYLKTIFPILVFLIALTINYFTDLQFVLNSDAQYGNFNEYLMNYNNLKSIIYGFYNIIRLFAYNFTYSPQNYDIAFVIFLHTTKVLIILLTTIGLFKILFEQLDKIKLHKEKYLKSLSIYKKPDISIYFLGLFIITIILYLAQKLPLGQARINYFAFLFTTYFMITGLFFLIKKVKYIKYILVPIVLFATIFQISRNYYREFENKNLIFDQKIYKNVGSAIINAQNTDLPIIVNNNEFYPASIMQDQENLIIKAHHLFKPNNPIKFYIIKSSNIKKLQDSLHFKSYIKLNKYNFEINKND